MSVIWEAKCKMCRRAGAKLFLKGDRCFSKKCSFETRAFPPGQHGQRNKDRKITEFATQLREKQKLRQTYHLREGQFRAYVEEAQRQRGVTGEVLVQLLEMRLDNVIHRIGWSPSRGQARQMVDHRFFTVNGKRVNIPSYAVRPGDVIGIHESKRSTALAQANAGNLVDQNQPKWIAVNPQTFEATVVRTPETEEVSSEIDVQKIIEFYSR